MTTNAQRSVFDSVGAPAFLLNCKTDLAVARQNWKGIEFHAMREHVGLVFQA